MFNRLAGVAVVLLMAVAACAGYGLLRSRMEAQIYRDRLVDLGRRHDRLGETYNEVVRKTAVSELLVDKGRVCVQIRTTEGVIETIRTPFAATSEIYVDFVVLDGRLWIRRVFDARTTPDQAVVIDPKLAQIDWDTVSSAIGKAVYRRLDDGRWVVTVTGDGSLGLARRNPDTTTGLQSAPAVRDYPPIEVQADADVQRIGALDVLRWLGRPSRW